MTKVKEISTALRQETVPIYCRKCRSRHTFDRHPEGDIMLENGKVGWERWRCSVCGNTVVYGTNNL